MSNWEDGYTYEQYERDLLRARKLEKLFNHECELLEIRNDESRAANLSGQQQNS